MTNSFWYMMAQLIQEVVDSGILLNNKRHSDRVQGSLGLMNAKECQDSPMQGHWYTKAKLINGRVHLVASEFSRKFHVQDFVLPN